MQRRTLDELTDPNGPVLLTLMNQFADVTGGLARHLRDQHGIGSVLLHVGELPDPRVYDLSPDDFLETIDYQQIMGPRPVEQLPSYHDLQQQRPG